VGACGGSRNSVGNIEFPSTLVACFHVFSLLMDSV
jgi:hypothetical protein